MSNRPEYKEAFGECQRCHRDNFHCNCGLTFWAIVAAVLVIGWAVWR